MTNVVALILAKSDSKRLPNKNSLDFNGEPMFLVNTRKCLSIFDQVYVSSDDLGMLTKAMSIGARAILRYKNLCGDTPNIPVYKHALSEIIEYYDKDVDAIVAVQANSPTIKPKIIEQAKKAIEGGKYLEVMTCHPIHPDNPIYGSVWAITKDKLDNYGDPYKPDPDFLIDDDSVDIHTLEDYNKAIKQYANS